MNHDDNQLSEAVEKGDWNTARHLAAIRVAKAMEATESPRETKALSLSLMELLKECEAADVARDYSDTPYARIMAEAKVMEANGW